MQTGNASNHVTGSVLPNNHHGNHPTAPNHVMMSQPMAYVPPRRAHMYGPRQHLLSFPQSSSPPLMTSGQPNQPSPISGCFGPRGVVASSGFRHYHHLGSAWTHPPVGQSHGINYRRKCVHAEGGFIC